MHEHIKVDAFRKVVSGRLDDGNVLVGSVFDRGEDRRVGFDRQVASILCEVLLTFDQDDIAGIEQVGSRLDCLGGVLPIWSVRKLLPLGRQERERLRRNPCQSDAIVSRKDETEGRQSMPAERSEIAIRSRAARDQIQSRFTPEIMVWQPVFGTVWYLPASSECGSDQPCSTSTNQVPLANRLVAI